MVSEAQKRARNKYDAAHYTTLGIKLSRDEAAEFKAVCAAHGTNPSAVFRAAMRDYVSRCAAGGPAEAQTGPGAPEGQGAPDGPDCDA